MTFFTHGGRQVPAAFRAPCPFCKEDQLFVKHRCVICGTPLVKGGHDRRPVKLKPRAKVRAHVFVAARREGQIARDRRAYLREQAAKSRAKYEGGA